MFNQRLHFSALPLCVSSFFRLPKWLFNPLVIRMGPLIIQPPAQTTEKSIHSGIHHLYAWALLFEPCPKNGGPEISRDMGVPIVKTIQKYFIKDLQNPFVWSWLGSIQEWPPISLNCWLLFANEMFHSRCQTGLPGSCFVDRPKERKFPVFAFFSTSRNMPSQDTN